MKLMLTLHLLSSTLMHVHPLPLMRVLSSCDEHPLVLQDDDRTVQTEVVEVYERRKDKLRKRETYPQKVGTTLIFLSGILRFTGAALIVHALLFLKEKLEKWLHCFCMVFSNCSLHMHLCDAILAVPSQVHMKSPALMKTFCQSCNLSRAVLANPICDSQYLTCIPWLYELFYFCQPQDTTAEYFVGGSSYGLKDILTIKNERRTINFYHTWVLAITSQCLTAYAWHALLFWLPCSRALLLVRGMRLCIVHPRSAQGIVCSFKQGGEGEEVGSILPSRMSHVLVHAFSFVHK